MIHLSFKMVMDKKGGAYTQDDVVVGLSFSLTAQRLSVPRTVGAMRVFLCDVPTCVPCQSQS